MKLYCLKKDKKQSCEQCKLFRYVLPTKEKGCVYCLIDEHYDTNLDRLYTDCPIISIDKLVERVENKLYKLNSKSKYNCGQRVIVNINNIAVNGTISAVHGYNNKWYYNFKEPYIFISDSDNKVLDIPEEYIIKRR